MDYQEGKIRSVTVGAVTRKHAHVRNFQLIRKLSTDDWNIIRIGVAFHMQNDTERYPVMGLRFFLGLCSGNTNCMGDATVTHAVGAGTLAQSHGGYEDFRLQRIVGTANTFDLYMNGESTGAMVFKSDPYNAAVLASGTLTATIGLVGTQDGRTGTPYANYFRCFFVIEMERGSPNWNIRAGSYALNTSPAQYAVNTADVFKEQMLAPDTGAIWAAHAPTSWTTRTLAVDEAGDGTLDHLNLVYDAEFPSMYVDQLMAVRMA